MVGWLVWSLTSKSTLLRSCWTGQFTFSWADLALCKRYPILVHSFASETNSCPSWISGRQRMTVENISWSFSTKERCRTRRGSNPRPPDHQSEADPTPLIDCLGLTTRQPLWVILCRLPEKGRREIVEEMKGRDRDERLTWMKAMKQKA